MLREDFTSVLDVTNFEELRAAVIGFANRQDFETVSATVVIDHAGSESEFLCVDNTPQAYRYIFEDRQGGLRDPVMQHCKRRSIPIVWDHETYTYVDSESVGKLRRGSATTQVLHWPRICRTEALLHRCRP